MRKAEREYDEEPERGFLDRLLHPFRRHGFLDTTPRPLVHPSTDLMVVWSAKSACTTTFAWFAAVTGMIEDLRASGLTPHKYRITRYFRSEAYRRAAARDPRRLAVVHVGRDPAQRAVSSYRHLVRTGYDEKNFARHPPPRPLDRRAGFSFNAFLDYLETLDLATCNTHHRRQWHPVETVSPPREVIDIGRTDLFTALNDVARRFGLPAVDFAALDWLHALEQRRKAVTGSFEGVSIPDLALDVAAARGQKPWPETAAFLTPETLPRIRRLYAVDYDRLGFPG